MFCIVNPNDRGRDADSESWMSLRSHLTVFSLTVMALYLNCNEKLTHSKLSFLIKINTLVFFFRKLHESHSERYIKSKILCETVPWNLRSNHQVIVLYEIYIWCIHLNKVYPVLVHSDFQFIQKCIQFNFCMECFLC